MNTGRNSCKVVGIVLVSLAAGLAIGCGDGLSPPDLAAFESFKKAQQVPTARVPLVPAAPEIDGVLDEVYKTHATPLKFSFLVGGDARPTARTTVYVVSTARELFIFYNCESPDMDDLMTDVRDHDGAIWSDDSVEMFIDPTDQRALDGYMHLGVTAGGVAYEARGKEHAGWDPEIRVKVSKGPKAWTAEFAIPFKELVEDPKKLNRAWAVNFGRMAYLLAGTEDTAWSPVGQTDSHLPAKFGCLWLDVGRTEGTVAR